MIEGRPSATAELVAVRRAVHQLIDRPLVFEDPFALRIVGPERERQIRADPSRQYVVLGAGLDAGACRNPYRDLRVFEVDAPSTQAWKLERLVYRLSPPAPAASPNVFGKAKTVSSAIRPCRG